MDWLGCEQSDWRPIQSVQTNWEVQVQSVTYCIYSAASWYESRGYAVLERQAVFYLLRRRFKMGRSTAYHQFETSYLYIAALHANCPVDNSDHSPTLVANVSHLYISRLGFPV